MGTNTSGRVSSNRTGELLEEDTRPGAKRREAVKKYEIEPFSESVFADEDEDYSTEILEAIGVSTQVEPVGFYLLGGYQLSRGGLSQPRLGPTYGSMVDTTGVPDVLVSGYYQGKDLAVLTNNDWYRAMPSAGTWRGLEMRPYMQPTDSALFNVTTEDGSSVIVGSSDQRTVAMRESQDQGAGGGGVGSVDAGAVGGTFGAMQASVGQTFLLDGYGGLDAQVEAGLQTAGDRGTLDIIFDGLMQLTGTVALTAFIAKQYPGTDYGVLFDGSAPLSNAMVVGHVGFGAEPWFAGESLLQGSFLWGMDAQTPRGPIDASNAIGEGYLIGGYDSTMWAQDNTYYICDQSPHYYNVHERNHLKTKFGYDAQTYADHPYVGVRERIYQAVSSFIVDLRDDVLTRVDVTKFINAAGLSEIKINRIEESEMNESIDFSPSNAGSMGSSTTSDPGGGSYGY